MFYNSSSSPNLLLRRRRRVARKRAGLSGSLDEFKENVRKSSEELRSTFAAPWTDNEVKKRKLEEIKKRIQSDYHDTIVRGTRNAEETQQANALFSEFRNLTTYISGALDVDVKKIDQRSIIEKVRDGVVGLLREIGNFGAGTAIGAVGTGALVVLGGAYLMTRKKR